MRRFFGKRENEKYFLIEGDEFYHLSKVLRAKEGEKNHGMLMVMIMSTYALLNKWAKKIVTA